MDKIIKELRRRNTVKSKPKNKVAKQVVKPAVAKTVPANQTEKRVSRANEIKHRVFFTPIPAGHFGYSRPHEARLLTEKEQKLLKEFCEDIEYRKRTRNYKFEDFLAQPDENATNRIKTKQ